MGSATTQALTATTAALNAATVDDLGVARELFIAARTIGESSQLSGALSAWGVPGEARAGVAAQVFATFTPTTVALLRTAVAERWSDTADLIAGVEELAIRAAAKAAPGTDLEQELFEVLRVVADQRGRTVATVHVARPLDAAQTDRLRAAMSERTGSDIALNVVVDASVVGGVRVEIGDEVIDDTVSSRLNDLRQRLAG